jgi:lipopolysaccharide/colanic/teichoic acid biosynthesis glycosyltransferase
MPSLYTFLIACLILLTLPLQILIAVTIFLTSGWPVFFAQKRVGLSGKPFVLYKFRSMKVGAHTGQKRLAVYNEASGPVFKIHNDPRYTWVGRFLAHTGLDEMPQLYNVLLGHMSLFGPRPLPIEEVVKLKPWQKKRHVIRPGIVSPWIFEGYHAQSFDAWMKSDIAYTKAKSWKYDAYLCARAVRLLFSLIRREITGS